MNCVADRQEVFIGWPSILLATDNICRTFDNAVLLQSIVFIEQR